MRAAVTAMIFSAGDDVAGGDDSASSCRFDVVRRQHDQTDGDERSVRRRNRLSLPILAHRHSAPGTATT